MEPTFAKRHEIFVIRLRQTLMPEELPKRTPSPRTVVRRQTASREEAAKIQAELEAKFDELFGGLDDDDESDEG